MKHCVDKFFIVFLIVSIPLLAQAQSVLAPYNPEYYHLIDRYSIGRGAYGQLPYSSIRPYTRQGIAQLADSVLGNAEGLSPVDQANLTYLLVDNYEWAANPEMAISTKPIWKHFYQKKSAFLDYEEEGDFWVQANPIVYVSAGRDGQLTEETFQNTRGAEIRGMIGKKVGFYTMAVDNQARFPWYVQQYTAATKAVPGEIFWKDYGKGGADFFQARGYVTFNLIKQISFQFGQDKHFIGSGHRSLLLSDFSAPYTFFRLDTKVKKLTFTNLYAKMTAEYDRLIGRPYPSKFLALHYLSWNIRDNLNLGIFESVVFGRQDSLSTRGFDLYYLNPVIFYRALELGLGDADNVNLGFDIKWNFLNKFQAYGMLVIDDLFLKEWFDGTGWFANRYGMQLGMKYINAFGVPNLDLQGEFNRVSPYTYAHFSADRNLANYQHYNQALAHPLGANFNELVGIIRYQPIFKVNFVAKAMYSRQGKDLAGENWGSNIMADYSTREQDYGNFLGQGTPTNMIYLDFMASYQIKHNLFVDLRQVVRDVRTDAPGIAYRTLWTTAAIRWNFVPKSFEF